MKTKETAVVGATENPASEVTDRFSGARQVVAGFLIGCILIMTAVGVVMLWSSSGPTDPAIGLLVICPVALLAIIILVGRHKAAVAVKSAVKPERVAREGKAAKSVSKSGVLKRLVYAWCAIAVFRFVIGSISWLTDDRTWEANNQPVVTPVPVAQMKPEASTVYNSNSVSNPFDFIQQHRADIPPPSSNPTAGHEAEIVEGVFNVVEFVLNARAHNGAVNPSTQVVNGKNGPYVRTTPNGTKADNFSHSGNTNPATGQHGNRR